MTVLGAKRVLTGAGVRPVVAISIFGERSRLMRALPGDAMDAGCRSCVSHSRVCESGVAN